MANFLENHNSLLEKQTAHNNALAAKSHDLTQQLLIQLKNKDDILSAREQAFTEKATELMTLKQTAQTQPSYKIGTPSGVPILDPLPNTQQIESGLSTSSWDVFSTSTSASNKLHFGMEVANAQSAATHFGDHSYDVEPSMAPQSTVLTSSSAVSFPVSSLSLANTSVPLGTLQSTVLTSEPLVQLAPSVPPDIFSTPATVTSISVISLPSTLPPPIFQPDVSLSTSVTLPVTTSDAPISTSTSLLTSTTTTGAVQQPVVTTSPIVTSQIPALQQPTVTTSFSLTAPKVIVKQQLPVKPFNGSTSWKSFRDHFQRIAAINGWQTPAEKVQHLSVSLEGPAVDVLKDINENDPDAWTLIWDAIKRRFAPYDDAREAMRKFDACKQQDDQSIPEFEQKLRTLHREAWPSATADQRDSDLKRKFEEGLLLTDMRQFLRLHAANDTFEQTVIKARQFVNAVDTTRPKKVVRIATIEDHSASGQAPVTTEQAILQGMQSISQTLGDRLDKILNIRTPTAPLRNQTSPGQQGHDNARGRRQARQQEQGGRNPSQISGGQHYQQRNPRSANRNRNDNDNFQPRWQQSRSPSPAWRSPTPMWRQPPHGSGPVNGWNNNDRHWNNSSPSPAPQPRSHDNLRQGSQQLRPPSPAYQYAGQSWQQSPRDNWRLAPYQNRGGTNTPPGRYDQRSYQSQPYRNSGNTNTQPHRADDRSYSSRNDQSPRVGMQQRPRSNSVDSSRTGCWVCGRYGCHSSNHTLPQSPNTQLLVEGRSNEPQFEQRMLENPNWDSTVGQRTPEPLLRPTSNA